MPSCPDDGPRSAGLRRDLDLLDALAADDAQPAGLGVVRLAQRTGRIESQVSRALAALAAEGLVERDPVTRRYTLGQRLYYLATRTTEARLVRLGGRAVGALAAGLGLDVHLCRLHGDAVATVLSADADGTPPRSGFAVHEVPAAVTSSGRVLLAFRDAPRLAAALRARGLDPGIARRVLAEGRAVVDGELDPALAGASAPVRDGHGGVVAALNVVGPAERIRPVLAAVADAAAAAAAELSSRMASPTV